MNHTKDQRGAAAVELALVLPILATLIFGAVECGRYFYAKNTLTHAAREGARVLALGGTAGDVAATVDGTDGDLATTIAFPNGETCVPPSDSATGTPAAVTTSVDFTISIPFITVSVPDPTSTAVMRCGG